MRELMAHFLPGVSGLIHADLNHGSTQMYMDKENRTPVFGQAICVYPRPSAVQNNSGYCARRARHVR